MPPPNDRIAHSARKKSVMSERTLTTSLLSVHPRNAEERSQELPIAGKSWKSSSKWHQENSVSAFSVRNILNRNLLLFVIRVCADCRAPAVVTVNYLILNVCTLYVCVLKLVQSSKISKHIHVRNVNYLS